MLNHSWDKVWRIKRGYSGDSLRKLKARKKVDWLMNMRQVTDTDIVADLGCGGGYISKHLSDLTRCKIIGVDISKNAIATAKRLCNRSNTKFLVQSITELSLENNSVDVVMCVGSLEHVIDFDKAIKEVHRILKPGGFLFVVSTNYHSFVHMQVSIKQKLKIWKFGYEKDWKSDDLIQALTKAGFKKEKCFVKVGFGDLRIENFLDKTASLFNKKFGRYIVYGGVKRSK